MEFMVIKSKYSGFDNKLRVFYKDEMSDMISLTEDQYKKVVALIKGV